MPGLSLVAASTLHKGTLSTAVGDLKSDYSPLADILYCDEHIALVFSGHDGYPCRFYENEAVRRVCLGHSVIRDTKKVTTIQGDASEII